MRLTTEPAGAVTAELGVGEPAPVRPQDDLGTAGHATPAQRLVLYGDFNCPWSYLASRRAAWLAADGVEVDWRAVEHDPPHPRAPHTCDARDPEDEAPPPPVRLGALLDEMEQVLTVLLPGEELPYALAGFAPRTGAAVAAYAEAYRAGVAGRVRRVLFEALWLHAFDLDDPHVVHTLIIDAVRSGATVTSPLAAWDYRTGVVHQPGATTGQLLDAWATEWLEEGNRIVPTLVVGGELVVGVDAVRWLGTELVRRGLPVGSRSQPARARASLA